MGSKGGTQSRVRALVILINASNHGRWSRDCSDLTQHHGQPGLGDSVTDSPGCWKQRPMPDATHMAQRPQLDVGQRPRVDAVKSQAGHIGVVS